jgi:hypothetical protein
VGCKPHAEQCRPERAALLCAFHRGEVCPRGVYGECWCAGPQEGADKGQEANNSKQQQLIEKSDGHENGTKMIAGVHFVTFLMASATILAPLDPR